MKHLFFLALLVNIVFFLWEYNSVQVAPPVHTNNNEAKQILLLSELKGDEKKDVQEVASIDKHTHYDFILPNEVHSQIQSNPIAESNALRLDEAVAIVSNKAIKIVADEEKKIDVAVLNQQIENIANNRVAEEIIVKAVDEVKENNTIGSETEQTDIQNQTEVTTENKPLDLVETENQLEAIEELVKLDKKKRSVTSKNPLLCYQIGPFLTEQALDDWLDLNNFVTTTRFKQEVEVLISYLVYYPAAVSFQQSINNVKMLKDKGVTDYWLFTKGEDKGIISLGLFKKQSRALSLQQKFIQSGLQVEMMPRYQTQLAWFIRIENENEISIKKPNISDGQTLTICE